jgi:hypothetical protein
MMVATRRNGIVELCLASKKPVHHVLADEKAEPAAGLAAAPVPDPQGASQRGRGRAGAAPEAQDLPVLAADHPDEAPVAAAADGFSGHPGHSGSPVDRRSRMRRSPSVRSAMVGPEIPGNTRRTSSSRSRGTFAMR